MSVLNKAITKQDSNFSKDSPKVIMHVTVNLNENLRFSTKKNKLYL